MSECETCGTEFGYEEYSDGDALSRKMFANGVKTVYFCSEECMKEDPRYKSDAFTDDYDEDA